ncbi:cobalt transporter [Piscirickettsia salmonis]|uniref:Ferrous-iron efflux pump FieF n=1 Tax=Piscirickettsia salmonis TaxID=1238 RepID=A0A9Q5VLF9_PISSA|nr:cation diffusion facilitator family transporter [Piscirickettsia salmonis]ALA23643.1 cation diffusion facilitator transporter family protein [Piscirickettsia salmonis]APS44084.1 cobalt transporter [Piscirickettsia salmonis]APS47445.1 cobalt transporter [Piscirickettsia salmonis]APS51119.1 cobalt transporter [Piscirickettsia salmonis]APS54328.1 cobalt transporter [Piscirickettsia salmonis]
MNDTARYQAGRRATLIGAGLNFCLAVLKIVVGLFGRSHALVADGIHSFSDLICDFFVLMAARYGMSEPDQDHPYGHGRIETVATVVLSIFLITLGVGIGIDAFYSLVQGSDARPDSYTLIIAVISIVVNEGLFRYTLKVADQINSDLLRANAWHSRGDSLSSLIVLIGIIGSLLGWSFLDAVAAIIVALMIIKMGMTWGWRALKELIDTALPEDQVADIANAIRAIPHVLAVHDLRTRKMAGYVLLDVHILIHPYISASEGHFIAEQVRAGLMQQFASIRDITVHVDVEEHAHDLNIVKLLSRDQINHDLMPVWQTILGVQQPVDFMLHYLQEKVIIDLYLPNKVIKGADAIIAQLQNSVSNYPDVEKLRAFLKVKA